MGREGTAVAALAGPRFLRSRVRDEGLLVTTVDVHTKMIAEVQKQGVNALIVRGIHRLL